MAVTLAVPVTVELTRSDKVAARSQRILAAGLHIPRPVEVGRSRRTGCQRCIQVPAAGDRIGRKLAPGTVVPRKWHLLVQPTVVDSSAVVRIHCLGISWLAPDWVPQLTPRFGW